MAQPLPARKPLDNRTPEWWKSAVVYQIYPRSFADSNGDGVGDLRGIIDKLDYLAELGIDVLWVSPFFPSPMADNGYDISDYCDVDPLFGTLADVDELIEGVHERGIYLMIDLVPNHTSEAHSWFAESRASTDNPKRDWYWWRPPRDGMALGEPGAEPTNWMGFFSESTWTPDEATGEYYLHIFTAHQPDLNWENPQVRAELHRTMRWWLDRGVDGFRMDVVNLVSKHTPLQDAEPQADSWLSDGSPHFVCGPRIHEFMHELNQEVVAGRDKVVATVGEMPGVTPAHARRFSDPARAELDMVFQFEHMGVDHGPGGRYDPVPLDWVAMKEVLARWQDELGTSGWNSLYWDNHDQPRAVSRFGDDDPGYRALSATALATILHLQRGTPFIYQGEELGMTNYPFTSIEQIDDVESRNFYALATSTGASAEQAMASVAVMSRDHGRTPMHWDETRNAGFSSGTPWLPVNPNHTQINVARQLADPSSVLHYHRRLIELRHTLDVVAHGDFAMLAPEHPTLFAYLRRHPSGSLVVVANCSRDDVSAEEVRAALPAWRGELLLANHEDPPVRQDGQVADLGAWQAHVYRSVDDMSKGVHDIGG